MLRITITGLATLLVMALALACGDARLALNCADDLHHDPTPRSKAARLHEQRAH